MTFHPIIPINLIFIPANTDKLLHSICFTRDTAFRGLVSNFNDFLAVPYFCPLGTDKI